MMMKVKPHPSSEIHATVGTVSHHIAPQYCTLIFKLIWSIKAKNFFNSEKEFNIFEIVKNCRLCIFNFKTTNCKIKSC